MARAIALVMLIVVAAAACQKEASPAAGPRAPQVAAPLAVARPTSAPLVARPLDVTTLPPVRYAGIVYEARSGSLDPEGSGMRARLVVQATAPSKFEVPMDGVLTLEFTNGARVHGRAPALGAAQVADLTLSGPVPADSVWDGATLTIAESGKVPQRVTVGQPEPPRREVLAPGPAVTVPSRYGEPITYTMADAALELDGPRTGGFFERAGDLERFLRVRVTVLNKGAPNGVSIGMEKFELLADGASANVAVGMFARTVTFNQSLDVELVYRVPTDAKALAVKVGADGRKPGEIALARAEQAAP
jgi:hypothetical protein